MKIIAPWELKGKYIYLKSNEEIKLFIDKINYVIINPKDDEKLIDYLLSLESVGIYFDVFVNINIINGYIEDIKNNTIDLDYINFSKNIIKK